MSYAQLPRTQFHYKFSNIWTFFTGRMVHIICSNIFSTFFFTRLSCCSCCSHTNGYSFTNQQNKIEPNGFHWMKITVNKIYLAKFAYLLIWICIWCHSDGGFCFRFFFCANKIGKEKSVFCVASRYWWQRSNGGARRRWHSRRLYVAWERDHFRLKI